MDCIHKGIWPVGFVSGSTCLQSSAPMNTSGCSGGNDACDQNMHLTFSEQQEDVSVEDAVPLDVEEEDEEAPFKWDDNSDKALIEEVYEARQHYEGKNMVKNVALFGRVAQHLNLRNFKINRDGATKRYQELKKKFNEICDGLPETGKGKCKWPLFHDMCEMEKDSVTVKAPVTVSAGVVPKVARAYEAANKIRNGKERPPNPTRQQRVEKLMGQNLNKSSRGGSIGVKNQALELQQQRLELERQYFEEFRSYRLDAQARGKNFQEGVKVLADLKKVQEQLLSSIKE